MPTEPASSEAILSALVGFDTTSRNSNLPLLAWVEDYLDRHGVAHERVPDATGEKANLFATIGPREVPGIVLSGHTDVVPVDGQDWASDPFALEERDGRLYGRGSADMKGFLACCLAAVPAMAAAPLRRPIHLAFSYDEEVGCLGVRRLIDALAGRGAAFEACIVGEPTSMQVVVAHKAKRTLRAEFRGRACHSSLAPRGVNAISYAARLVAKMDEMAARLADAERDELFDMPVTTAQAGTIRGGTTVNIVPGTATVEVELRVLPCHDADALVDEVGGFVEGLGEEMAERHPSCGASWHLMSGYPGLDTSPDAPVTGLAKRLAERNDHAKVAFGTEGGLIAEGLAVPTIVIGPGSIGEAHQADEFVAVGELRKCDAFLGRLVAHCAG